MTPILDLEDVTFSYADTLVLDELSFTLRPGFLMRHARAKRAGKTALMHLGLGLLKPSAGHVALFGGPAWDAPTANRARIGFVPLGHGHPLSASTSEDPVGDALPAVRDLAGTLTVNPNTVSKAYNQTLKVSDFAAVDPLACIGALRVGRSSFTLGPRLGAEPLRLGMRR